MYEEQIVAQLKEKLGRDNRLSLPRLDKIVVNMGVGSAVTEKKHMEEAAAALGEITGQKPVRCKAKKSIAAFRLREGLEIGCKVTLRGLRMYEFLDRLISLALPRVRDFRGLNPNAFDGHGNYSLGLSRAARVSRSSIPTSSPAPQGMNVTIVPCRQQRRRIARAAAGLRHAVPGAKRPARARSGSWRSSEPRPAQA